MRCLWCKQLPAESASPPGFCMLCDQRVCPNCRYELAYKANHASQTPASTLKRIVMSAGSQSALARRLHIRPQSIQSWIYYGRVPAERVLEVERLTGVPRHEIRPDLYPRSES
jgi:hypothetical protein